MLVGCSEQPAEDDTVDTDDGAPDDDTPTQVVGDPEFGFIAILSGEIPYGAPAFNSTSVSAGFTVFAGQDQACVRSRLSDECTDTTCDPVDPSGQFAAVDAGTIDVSGLTEPVQLVETQYEGFYSVFYAGGGGSFFVPGQTVTAAASGGTVPAFTVSAPAPDQYLVMDDPESGASQVTVPRTQDRVYTWEPRDRGTVSVALHLLEGPGALRSIECVSRLGTPLVNELVIPLSKVEAFNAPAAIESIRYTSQETIAAGDFTVLLELGSPVVITTGELYAPRTLTFE